MPAHESQESSSPIVTRSVAAGLRGEYCNSYQFPAWQRWLLNSLGVFPQGVARYMISQFQSFSGQAPEVLNDFNFDDLIRQRINDYAQIPHTYPAITIGAALGGASSYLSLSLGGPFLPQAFVTTLKGGSRKGNVEEYLNRTLKTALRIADENQGMMTIQHFDPVHDGWLTRFVNHLRFKLLDLPPAYAEFIKSRLQPHGALVYLEGGASWLRYKVGPRSVFQVGGWGGISPEEFLEGSLRLREYALRSGLKNSNWKLAGFPLEQGPESEWGSEPGLDVALQNFCYAEGYRFIRVSLPHPNDFSRLAFTAARRLLEKENREPAGVLVEMFSQFDATAARKAGLLPLWLIFNTNDSLDYLKEMVGRFPIGKPVFFSPLATFSVTPDMIPWKDWEEALSGTLWTNIGVRPSHYPSDPRTLIDWFKPLRKWVSWNNHPIKGVLDAEELLSLSSSILKETRIYSGTKIQ